MTRELYLGAPLDPTTGSAQPGRVGFDPSDLTTHGVIVGMTGSGKTGLGVVLLEELLSSGIPTLILDPKGDMTNLALTFPALDAASFRPWIDPAGARAGGASADELAATTATRWRDGLAASGLGPDDLRALRAAADVQVVTPGSTAATPLNVLGSLAAPAGPWETTAEQAREEIEGLVSGLLGLVGVDADPLTSREHILLSNLVENAWRAGRDLDLPSLIQQVQTPPLRKLGVFELDAFYPAADRSGLAMRLNGLCANPGFAPWLEGVPADIGALLYGPGGKPRATIVYLAHLSEAERQFVVTLVLSKVATWMQTQPGTSELRALVYMDEVYGFAPPNAAPPSKKPILTLLKQARAFGVGLVLSTQNPVDLDYKAMSNAGTWMIGRLQTERDKLRIVEALRSATGEVNVAALDARISGLGKRQFLLHTARARAPQLFTTRWAMSYLRGPVTKAELGRLPLAAPPTAAPSASPRAPAAPARDDETALPPAVADGVPVRFLAPDAPWASQLSLEPASRRVAAALVARCRLTFDERKADLDHTAEWEAIAFPLGDRFEPAAMTAIDVDDRDFVNATPHALRYELPRAPIGEAKFFRSARKALAAHLHRAERVTLHSNPELKLYGRIGESRDAFTARCERAAEDRADAETAKLRDKLERKLNSRQRALDTARRQLDTAEASHAASKRDEVVGGVGSLLGALLGGRASTRSMATRASRSARGLSSRRGRTSRAAAKVDAATDKIEDIAAEIEDLEQEVAEQTIEIDARWSALAGVIDELEVGLEKNDIDIVELALAWLPVTE